MKFKAYIKHMKLWVDVQRINFDVRTIECYLTDSEEGDMSEYDFDEIELVLTGVKVVTSIGDMPLVESKELNFNLNDIE